MTRRPRPGASARPSRRRRRRPRERRRRRGRPSPRRGCRRRATAREERDANQDEAERLSLGPERVAHEPSWACALDHVHRGVHHDPHYVHEVPIDPRQLDAEVVVGLGPVVPADRANERVQQQVEPDEDVRAVQAGEPEEGRARTRCRTAPKPMRVYSRAWISRNVRPSRNVSASPAISPERLFRLIDWSAQCIEKLDVTRMIVLTRAR